MHRLFSPNFEFGGGVVLPEFERTKVGLREQIARVIAYRRENPRGVMGSHFLVRLLSNLNISLNYDLDFYIDRVEAIAIEKSIALRMTSAYQQGELFKNGVFYSRFNTRNAWIQEILIATTDDFDVDDFAVNWRDCEPIRVMYHPMADINMQVPDGYQNFDGEGIAVIKINIPMLAAQYKLWRDDRRQQDEAYGPRSLEQFIQEIPIPNMLHSHVDIAVLNRTILLYYGADVPGHSRVHPFAMIDWTRKLDDQLVRYTNILLPRRQDFDSIIARLPIISARSHHETIRLPETGYTRYLQWAVILARLPLLAFLLHQNHAFENKRNNYYLTRLRNYFRMVNSGSILRSALSRSDYQNAQDIIDYGITPYL